MYFPDPPSTRALDTESLRRTFLVPDLFRPGALELRAFDLDRVVLGGAMPLDAPLTLETPPLLAAEYFTERRELGVVNLGGPGRITVDGQGFDMAARDGLYIGRGSRDVQFESASAGDPARYYLVSYPAHAEYPTAHVPRAGAQGVELGDAAHANRRRIYKYFHPEGVATAQLVMGITELEEGSVWNTMPPHTHQRRTEVYLYFDLPPDQAVVHLMGEPQQTRHLLVGDGQAVLSPAWSIHAGCGTARYSFCWAMGGENQDFADMQGVGIRELR
jgi:4-deoxy-L-threo-5-hexosulose-uronate ketol-isomerase